MNVLIFDTETTGLPLWKEPSDHPDQPRLVDIACDLWSDPETLVDSFDAIVNPGIEIPEELAALHGITTEIALAEGIMPAVMLDRFFDMVSRADLIVGHNVSFDIRMMRIEAARHTGEKWENGLPTYCTMRKATNHCRIPSPRQRHPEDWKWPNLGEAVQHFFGEEHVGGHRARPDTDAARRIYFHLTQKVAA